MDPQCDLRSSYTAPMDNSPNRGSLLEFAEIMWPRMQDAGFTYVARFRAPDLNGKPRKIVVSRELGPWLHKHSEDLAADPHWAWARSHCVTRPKDRIYRMELALIHVIHGTRPLRGAL